MKTQTERKFDQIIQLLSKFGLGHGINAGVGAGTQELQHVAHFPENKLGVSEVEASGIVVFGDFNVEEVRNVRHPQEDETPGDGEE